MLLFRSFYGRIKPSNLRLCSQFLRDLPKFERVCDETLESLSEHFEEVIQSSERFKSGDVNYSSGVLTVQLGADIGVYVINRQTPNRQIWLSSPRSGPKRYDFDLERNSWIYKHDGKSLHRLLQNEIGAIPGVNVDFSKCSHAGKMQFAL